MSEFSTWQPGWQPEPVRYGDRVFTVVDDRPVLSPYNHTHEQEIGSEVAADGLENIKGLTQNVVLLRSYTGLMSLPGEQSADVISLTEYARLRSTGGSVSEKILAEDEPEGQLHYLDALAEDNHEQDVRMAA